MRQPDSDSPGLRRSALFTGLTLLANELRSSEARRLALLGRQTLLLRRQFDCCSAATAPRTNGGKPQFGSTFRLCFSPIAVISHGQRNVPPGGRGCVRADVWPCGLPRKSVQRNQKSAAAVETGDEYMTTSQRNFALLTGASLAALGMAMPAYAVPVSEPGIGHTALVANDTLTICAIDTDPDAPDCTFGTEDTDVVPSPSHRRRRHRRRRPDPPDRSGGSGRHHAQHCQRRRRADLRDRHRDKLGHAQHHQCGPADGNGPWARHSQLQQQRRRAPRDLGDSQRGWHDPGRVCRQSPAASCRT